MYKKTKLGFCIIWINDISHTYGRNFGFSLLANTDRNSLKSVATRARELSTMAAICRVETLVLLVLIAAIPATSTYYKGDTRDDTRSWKKDDVDDTKDDTRDDDDKTSQKKLLGKSTSGLNDDEDDTKDDTKDSDDKTSQKKKKLGKSTSGWKMFDEDDTKDDTKDNDDKTSQKKKKLGKYTSGWKNDDEDDTKDDTKDSDDKTSQKKKKLGKYTSGWKNDEDDTKDDTKDNDDKTSQKKKRGWKNDDEDDTGEQIDLQDIGEYENDVMDLLIKQARLQNTSLEQGFIYTNKTEEVFSKKITRKLKRVHKS